MDKEVDYCISNCSASLNRGQRTEGITPVTGESAVDSSSALTSPREPAVNSC